MTDGLITETRSAEPAMPVAADLLDAEPAIHHEIAPRPKIPATPPLLTTATSGHIRAFDAQDLAGVADLFLTTFRPRTPAGERERAATEVAATMRSLYLEGPCCDVGPNGLVHVDPDGRIGGFLGFMKSTVLFERRPLRACVNTALMAVDDQAHRRVGPQLLRAFVNSPFDLFLTDSANRTSMAFARPMKFEVSPLQSLVWSRPFRPAAMAYDLLRRRWPALPASLMAPAARAADYAIRPMLRGRRGRALPRRLEACTIDAADFARLAPQFLEQFRLRPAWTERELTWLLDHAARRDSPAPLNLYRVAGPDGAAVGCFAFHGAPQRTATLLHILAREAHWDGVVDCMMHTVEEAGCVGVQGTGQAQIMPRLYAYPDLVLHHAGATITLARDPQVQQAIREGGALLGGLIGDRWTRLSNGHFGG